MGEVPLYTLNTATLNSDWSPLELRKQPDPVTLSHINDRAIEDQLLRRNVKRFRGGLVFKAHRLLYHPTLGSRVIKKKTVPASR